MWKGKTMPFPPETRLGAKAKKRRSCRRGGAARSAGPDYNGDGREAINGRSWVTAVVEGKKDEITVLRDQITKIHERLAEKEATEKENKETLAQVLEALKRRDRSRSRKRERSRDEREK
jgi:hypothetical protein